MSRTYPLRSSRSRDPHFIRIGLALVITAIATGCGGGNGAPKEIAQTVYTNGNILTVDKENSAAQAIAIKDGKILAVGRSDAIAAHIGADTAVVDLQGKTMIPGIYDAHSHFSAPNDGEFTPNLNSPPLGPIRNMDDLVSALQAHKAKVAPTEWITASGYDDTLLTEKRHPTKDDLDRVSTTQGVSIGHISGHLSTVNSVVLALAGITRDTPNPPGGIIFRDPNGEPTGVLGESARSLVSRFQPPSTLTAEERAARSEKTTAKNISWYASYGVTTANQGAGSSTASLENYDKLVQDGKMPIRLVGWTGIAGADAANLTTGKIKVGGVKLFHDGSIQGFTGYLGAPYHTPFEGDPNFRGFPSMTRDELVSRVTEIHKSGRQVLIHGNGDAAIDDILYAFRKAQEAFPRTDTRHTVIHSQMMREDQLDDAKELGVIPSFFVLHTYYWGDRHRDIFMGPERAARMSPTRSAMDRGMVYTIHTDAPIVPMDPMMLIWSAVNRISTSGALIGGAQRIPAAEALRATTINAAYQNFEDKERGSIEAGKYADLVILSDNLVKVDPMAIKDIKILETIVEGKTAYRAVD